MPHEGARRRLRVGAAGADGGHVVVGLDHVAVSRDDEESVAAHGDHEGLQVPQHPVRPPVLRQFHGGPQQVAVVLFELLVEAVEEREGVRRCAGKPDNDPVVEQPADLAGPVLDDRLVVRDLAVAGHDQLVLVADGEDGGAVKLHVHSPFAQTTQSVFGKRRVVEGSGRGERPCPVSPDLTPSALRPPRFTPLPWGARDRRSPSAWPRSPTCTSASSRDSRGPASPGSLSGRRRHRAGAWRSCASVCGGSPSC